MIGKKLAVLLAFCLLFSGAVRAGHHHHNHVRSSLRGGCAACAVFEKEDSAVINSATAARPFSAIAAPVAASGGLVKLSPVSDKFIIRPPPA